MSCSSMVLEFYLRDAVFNDNLVHLKKAMRRVSKGLSFFYRNSDSHAVHRIF